MHLRLQTTDVPAIEALETSLDTLVSVGEHIGGIFHAALQDFESGKE